MKIALIVVGVLALGKYLIKYAFKTKASLAHHKNQKLFMPFTKLWHDDQNNLYDEYGTRIGKFYPEGEAQA